METSLNRADLLDDMLYAIEEYCQLGNLITVFCLSDEGRCSLRSDASRAEVLWIFCCQLIERKLRCLMNAVLGCVLRVANSKSSWSKAKAGKLEGRSPNHVIHLLFVGKLNLLEVARKDYMSSIRTLDIVLRFVD